MKKNTFFRDKNGNLDLRPLSTVVSILTAVFAVTVLVLKLIGII